MTNPRMKMPLLFMAMLAAMWGSSCGSQLSTQPRSAADPLPSWNDTVRTNLSARSCASSTAKGAHFGKI